MKAFSRFILAILVLSLVGAASLSAAPIYNLKLTGAASDKSSAGDTAAMIKSRLEAESGGRIKVEVYLNAILGGDRELLEGCQAGDISMVMQATAPQVSFIPQLAVFDMPAALTDPDAAIKVLSSGAFRTKISAYYDKAGLKLLQLAPSAFREMSSNKAVRAMDDFKGIKIRTMENPYHLAFWKGLGANPTPLAFSELYIALQQNLVQAQENPVEVLTASKLGEVQKYVILTHHILFINTVVMNKKLYDGMPADIQALLDKVIYEAGLVAYKKAMVRADEVLAQLKSQGKEVIQPTPEVYAKIKDAAMPVYAMIAKAVGQDLVDAMLTEYNAAVKK
jgi:tripartite ATP-independent transporter DctP family solute receptor